MEIRFSDNVSYELRVKR